MFFIIEYSWNPYFWFKTCFSFSFVFLIRYSSLSYRQTMPLSIFLPFWTSWFVFILSLLLLWMEDAFFISLVFWFCFCSHGDSLTLSSVNDIDHMCGWPHALDIFWSRKWSLNLLLTFFLFSSLSGISVLLWFTHQQFSI